VYLSLLYDSQNEQLFPHAALTAWFSRGD
jgi:hypothetical protein